MNWARLALSIRLSLLFSTQLATGQGTLTVLNTGGGESLVSEARSVRIDSALVEPRLWFHFGFATDEGSVPVSFLDSFTVTIQDQSQLSTAIYLSADASGTVLAPPTPGTLVLDPATISVDTSAYPSLQPLLANHRAYEVSAAIPTQFVGGPMNVFFDLFDNMNGQASQGWFSDLRVVGVPEPRTWTLLLLAGAFCWRFNRLRK